MKRLGQWTPAAIATAQIYVAQGKSYEFIARRLAVKHQGKFTNDVVKHAFKLGILARQPQENEVVV